MEKTIQKNTKRLLQFDSQYISSFDPSQKGFTNRHRLIRYHYTSAGALLSILKKPVLRFTDVRYMNDRSELVYCVKCIVDYVKKHGREYPRFEKVVNELLLKKHTAEEYSTLSVSKVDFNYNGAYSDIELRCFIFCMSKNQDSLPMWNYYVKNGKFEGYNIGFNVYNFLKSFDTSEKESDPVSFIYGNILYDKLRQTKLIESLASLFENRLSSGQIGKSEALKLLRVFIESYGGFFKDETFKNEEEYRILLSLPQMFTNEVNKGFFEKNLKGTVMNYCERNGVLIPYLEVPINKNAIHSITVSPTVEKDIAAQSLRDLLSQEGYSADVFNSKIPIRF